MSYICMITFVLLYFWSVHYVNMPYLYPIVLYMQASIFYDTLYDDDKIFNLLKLVV